jgi:alpha-glucosidase
VRTVSVALLLLAAASLPRVQSRTARLESPDGRVALVIERGEKGQLTWRATLDGQPVIEPSALGLVVDGVNLGADAAISRADSYRVDERYPWRGVHATAVHRSNGSRLTVLHSASQTSYVVDTQVANDSVAIRFDVPGGGRRVPDAGTEFRLPAGSIVWTHGLRGHYEEQYERRRIEEVPEGIWAGPPVTFKLPGAAGYASITEAGLRDYAGMALQAGGGNVFYERLGHAHPPSYPYVLRYKEDNAKRLSVPASIDGRILTPWRVVLVGKDLNALVNSDAIHNLSSAPDKKLFPRGFATSWLKPGRAVWRYLDGPQANTFEVIKEFSRMAGELGFEHQVVEGQWQKWPEGQLKELVDYSRERNVGIWVWRHSNTLGDPDARRTLFEMLQKTGVVGVKVDFLDHEAKEVIDLYHAILKDAAEFQLMINFHGANKPAGESRTWPNELTREAIYGLEHRNAPSWAEFNTTMAFTRMLAGHADYTPVVFGERRKETSWTHQIATAIVLTSPVLVYGGNPASFLSSPAVELIKSIPSVWDETRVLTPSEIGELAAFARRRGNQWFVAALNGPQAREVSVPLPFLDRGTFETLVVRDNLEEAAALHVEQGSIGRDGTLKMSMRAGGGYIVRITRRN